MNYLKKLKEKISLHKVLPLLPKVEKPEKVPYNANDAKFKHYGKTLEKMVDVAVEMEEGELKTLLIQLIANHMKKSYLTWNKEAVADEQIFRDLKIISKDKIDLNIEQTTLTETREILAKNKRRRVQRKK